MHAKKLLHKVLNKAIHQKRIIVLTEIVQSVIKTKQLSLTALGRGLDSGIQERSGISKVNRLLANNYYQTKFEVFYGCLTEWMIGSEVRPEIVVDWTKLPGVEYYALRASLLLPGRALTLYEEVHAKKRVGNKKLHRNFLKCLKKLLPRGCCPIIVTDAGFKNPWFKNVLEEGWDFVGRVRGLQNYKEEGLEYRPCSELFKKANRTPESLGIKTLTRNNPLEVSFYIIKEKLKRRKNRTCTGMVSQHKDSIAYGQGHREPWLLASSLRGRWAAKKVIALYRKRMTIEEAFRDLKSSQYGLSFGENKTLKPKRLIVWLLLAALATFIAWVAGYIAEKLKLQYQFQANSIRSRRVLSFFYLGCQVLRKKLKWPPGLKHLKFTEAPFIEALI
jgi:hypothetical protein